MLPALGGVPSTAGDSVPGLSPLMGCSGILLGVTFCKKMKRITTPRQFIYISFTDVSALFTTTVT
jgi:hypothetical protein